MYLFLDIETTGFPGARNASIEDLDNWPRIVQLAWLQYDNNQNLVSEENHIIKPKGFSIPGDAVRVHGITTEKALELGINLETTLQKLAELISESEIIIAHNIDFDAKIIGAEFLRAGINTVLFNKQRFCTMKTTTELCKIDCPYGYKWPKLSELYYHLFKNKIEDTHDAAVDVKACVECFFELVRIGFIRL